MHLVWDKHSRTCAHTFLLRHAVRRPSDIPQNYGLLLRFTAESDFRAEVQNWGLKYYGLMLRKGNGKKTKYAVKPQLYSYHTPVASLTSLLLLLHRTPHHTCFARGIAHLTPPHISSTAPSLTFHIKHGTSHHSPPSCYRDYTGIL
jgi:hypothetical protein